MLIADGLKGTDETLVPVNGEYVKEAKIGSAIMDADVFISLTHFKGHETAGFGGTIKNIGMGCGSRAGKMEQHCEGKPSVATEACIGCGPAAESVHTERRSSQITKQKLIMINVLAAEDVLQSVQRMQFQQIMRTLLQC